MGHASLPTDRTITANRPDIVVKDSVNSTCKLIDMTVPSDRNIALKEIEKKSKYKDLELEIQRMWHMKTIVIPVVVCALGTVKKGMVENIKRVSERATLNNQNGIDDDNESNNHNNKEGSVVDGKGNRDGLKNLL